MDVCDSGSGSGWYTGVYYNVSIYDAYYPSDVLQPVFDAEAHSLAAYGFVQTAETEDVLEGSDAIRDVLKKFLKILTILDIFESIKNSIEDRGDAITDPELRDIIIATVELQCATSSVEDCAIALEERILSGVRNDSSINTDDLDEEWFRERGIAIDVRLSKRRNPLRWHCNYFKLRGTQIYYGITSAPEGQSCQQGVEARDSRHMVLRSEGFGPAQLEKQDAGFGAYAAMRGWEQQSIDSVDGPRRENLTGINRNVSRGVRKSNPFGCYYYVQSLRHELIAPYTGDGPCI